MYTVILATSYPGGILAIIFAIGWLVACVFSVCSAIATVVVFVRNRSDRLAPTFAGFTMVLAIISLISIILKLVCEASDKEVIKDNELFDAIVNETIPLVVGSVILMAIGVALWRLAKRRSDNP